jgi:recombination protein O
MRACFKKPLVHDEAFVTSIVRYGESDCIVRLFVKERGRITAFFKNGLGLKKNDRGTVQSPAFARVAYMPRDEDKMARLDSLDLAPESFLWASSLKLFAYGNYLAELLEKLLPEEEPAPHVFSLLEETKASCIAQGAQGYILRAFELKLLKYLGYLPQIPPTLGASVFYDPIHCNFSSINNSQAYEFLGSTLELAQSLLINPIGGFCCQEEKELIAIGRIFYGRLRLMNLLPLKSATFFRAIASNQKISLSSG